MKRNKQQTSKVCRSLTKVIVIGIIVALLLSVLLSAALTSLVLSGKVREGSVDLITFAVRMLSMLIGALIGGVLLKEKYLLQVLLTTLGYMLVLTGVGIVFLDGSLKCIPLSIVSVLLGGVIALIILRRPASKSYCNRKLKI